jgi:hypothetical protein
MEIKRKYSFDKYKELYGKTWATKSKNRIQESVQGKNIKERKKTRNKK